MLWGLTTIYSHFFTLMYGFCGIEILSILQARVSPIPLVSGVVVISLDPAFITKTVILIYHSILQARVSPIPPSSLVTGAAVVLDPAFITKPV